MTIAAKLLQINGVKEDIRDAIESFGYDLSNAEFTEYAQYICAIGTPTTIQITADGTNTGTISDDLTELTHVKTDIKNAIESKGISLTNVPFTEYAQYIYQIPVTSTDPLRFTAIQNGTIGWSDTTYPNIEFNKNGDGWEAFNSTINVNSGDYVEFRNNGTAWVATSDNSHFTTTGSYGTFNLSGNIMSLVDATMGSTTIPISSCFHSLFMFCINIVSADELELPTTLTTNCYTNMFWGCTALTTAPELPATTLTTACYSGMFAGCTSLTTAPELPATTLTGSCYSSMFHGCTVLTTAPELPATTTAPQCYASMFEGCTALTTAPELPATTTAPQCYASMFEGCTQLTTAPVLPALNPSPQSYSRMFYGCSSLNYLDARFTEKPTYQASNMMFFSEWLDGVAATGTFVKNPDATWVNTTVKHPIGYEITVIPDGWTIQCPLTFTALTAGSTVKIMASTNAPRIDISYAIDDEWKYGAWQPYQVGDTITLANVGDKVSFGGDGIINYRLSNSTSNRNYFAMTGSISAGGDVTSLLNGHGGDYQMNEGGVTNEYCFCGLFQDCTALVKAPNLPSTKLANHSYQRMFYGCTNLVTPPAELIAVTCSVGDNSNYMYRDVYSQMFCGCTSLVNTPHMKGIGNSRSTYARTPGTAASQMFYNCTALRNLYASGTWILGVKGYNSSTTTYSCSGWMAMVPQNVGTIHLPATSGYTGFDTFLNNRGNSGAPVGWSVSYDISI